MTGPSPAAGLDRHQQRREAGRPTVSVLSGSVGLAVRAGRQWAEGLGRPAVLVDDPRLEGMIDAWVDGLATGRNLVQDAVAWLARRLSRPAGPLGPRIGRMTPFEREAFLETVLPARSGSGTEAVCRWLLDQSAAGEPSATSGLAARLGAVLADRDGDNPREGVVAALRELVPPASDPVLLVARRAAGPEATAWVESAARSLARLALAQPLLALILTIEPGELGAYLRLAPESRAKALIRAGILPIAGLEREEIGRRLDAEVPGAPTQLAGPIQRLAADGASDELLAHFLDTARATAVPRPGPESDDLARSTAERFLFERLESLPATAGFFELNATLDFPFGPSRAMEVDLASRALGLAIEIDGYYHFQGTDTYRRDRRKDFELQRRGYLVVRVLAEDVVPRLEEVLDLILAAVTTRRDRGTRQRGETP